MDTKSLVMKALADLMRRYEKVKQKLADELWGGAACKSLAEESKVMIQKYADEAVQIVETKLVSVSAEVSQYAGGMDDGSRWDKSLSRASSWQSVVDQAKLSLEKLAPKRLD
eukprot:729272-Amphidinium_carterae.1